EEALMKTFPRDLRTMIRKGIKNNLTAEVGREELLDEFYDVYATSVRNLGTPVFPKKLFAGFLREFPRDSDILLVRQGGRVAGGVLSFYFRGCVLPYYGGARLDELRLRPQQARHRGLRIQTRLGDDRPPAAVQILPGAVAGAAQPQPDESEV